MTEFQSRVLNAMPDTFSNVPTLTDIVYKRDAGRKANILRQSKIWDAVLSLKKSGFVISNGKGYFRPFDYDGKTSSHDFRGIDDGMTPAEIDDMEQRTEETQRQDDYDSASEGHP